MLVVSVPRTAGEVSRASVVFVVGPASLRLPRLPLAGRVWLAATAVVVEVEQPGVQLAVQVEPLPGASLAVPIVVAAAAEAEATAVATAAAAAAQEAVLGVVAVDRPQGLQEEGPGCRHHRRRCREVEFVQRIRRPPFPSHRVEMGPHQRLRRLRPLCRSRMASSDRYSRLLGLSGATTGAGRSRTSGR